MKESVAKIFKFDAIFSGKGEWVVPGYVELNVKGKVVSISFKKPKSADRLKIKNIRGYLIPGFINAHSHVFQTLFAGDAEKIDIKNKSDHFWSWRDQMYHHAATLTPELLQKTAENAFREMLRLGYTHVVEFHYLHHDTKGKPYKNRLEMAQRILEAAQNVSMPITLLPVYYERNDFDKPLHPIQRRFLSKSVDEYLELKSSLDILARQYKRADTGLCVHSLRAVRPENVIEVLSEKGLRHIHISEQKAEVATVKKHLKKSPVDWLLDNVPGGFDLNLVHATHVSTAELRKIVKTKANVVLCPTTEANLGDGIFPLPDYIGLGGKFTIASDSNVNFFPPEELRWLDYTHRLVTHERQPLFKHLSFAKNVGEFDMAKWLFCEVIRSGFAARGIQKETLFDVGDDFDGIILDPDHARLQDIEIEKVLGRFIYASDSAMIGGSVVSGGVL